MNSPEATPPPPDRSKVAEYGIGAIKDLAVAALKETPGHLIALVVIPCVAAILAIILAVILIFQSAAYAFVSGLVAFALLGVALVCWVFVVMRYQVQHEGAGLIPARRQVEPTWEGKVLKLPLPNDKLEELASDLRNIRNDAILWLQDRRKDIDLSPDQIRANIFLPDCNQASIQAPFTLFIHERLSVNMDGNSDRGITFRPGQGLTGGVFLLKEPMAYAQTVQKSEGHQFKEVYQLTAEHKKMLHPELRWVVSLALTVPENGGPRKAVGVLNVDGLAHIYHPDDLNLLLAHLSTRVAKMSDKLAGLPKATIKILVEV